MKIKRFDNLWLMGLILCAVILVAVYVLKIFFPHFVIEVAQIESVTVVGHYIDTHKWAWYLASFVLSFFVYYFQVYSTKSGRKAQDTACSQNIHNFKVQSPWRRSYEPPDALMHPAAGPSAADRSGAGL